jgi:hypothetical protein
MVSGEGWAVVGPRSDVEVKNSENLVFGAKRPGLAQRVCELDARCYSFRSRKEGTGLRARFRSAFRANHCPSSQVGISMSRYDNWGWTFRRAGNFHDPGNRSECGNAELTSMATRFGPSTGSGTP